MAPYHGVLGIEHLIGRQIILPRDLLTLPGIKPRLTRQPPRQAKVEIRFVCLGANTHNRQHHPKREQFQLLPERLLVSSRGTNSSRTHAVRLAKCTLRFSYASLLRMKRGCGLKCL